MVLFPYHWTFFIQGTDWAVSKGSNQKEEPNFILYQMPDLPGFKNLAGLRQRKRNKIWHYGKPSTLLTQQRLAPIKCPVVWAIPTLSAINQLL